MNQGGGDGWNDVIPLDTGKFACRWHHHGDVLLVGCQHPDEAEAHAHCFGAARARAAIDPPPTSVPADLTEDDP